LWLEVGLPVAADGPESLGETRTCERSFIGGSDFVPESCRLGEEQFRVHCVALREPHPSSSKGGAGDERLAAETRGDELQLRGG